MIPVLLAALGVAAGRLDVAVVYWADPDIRVGGRNGQLADAGEGLRVRDGFSVRAFIGEARSCLSAADARLLVRDINQSRALGRLDRIDDRAELRVAFDIRFTVHAPSSEPSGNSGGENWFRRC